MLSILLLSGCAEVAAETAPRPAATAPYRATVTHTQDDPDYSPDPPTQADRERAASFAAALIEAQRQVDQGQGGHYGQPFASFAQALECTTKLTTAEAGVAPCAQALFVNGCGNGHVFNARKGECPECQALIAADDALAAAKCPARAVFPSLRGQ